MAIPADAKVFLEPLDPTDIMDYEIDLGPILESGEGVASYSLAVPTESSVLGLEIRTTTPYATTINTNILRIWLGINTSFQSNVSFTAGVTLPIIVTIDTDSTPLRRKQRTVAVKVIQR